MNDLFSTEGRVSRLTFWKFFAIIYILLAIIGWIAEHPSFPMIGKLVLDIVGLAALVVGIFVQIKRWHDRGKSGWWILINFLPCIGGLWALIECGFLKGTDGPNQYGPDPLQGA